MTGTAAPRVETDSMPLRAGRWAIASALAIGAALALVPVGAFHDRRALLVAGAVCFVLAQVCAAARRLVEVSSRHHAAKGATFTGVLGVVAASTLLGATLGALLGLASRSGTLDFDVVDADALRGAGVGAAVVGGGVIVAMAGRRLARWLFTPDDLAPAAATTPWLVLPRRVSTWSAAALVAAGGSTALSIATLVAGNEGLRWYAGGFLLAALVFAWIAKRAADVDGVPRRVER